MTARRTLRRPKPEAGAECAGTLAQEYAPVITPVFAVGGPGGPTLSLNGNTDVDLKVSGVVATNLVWVVSDVAL